MSVNDLLFDTPWWILVLLIGGGVYVWYLGNARLDKTFKIVGTLAILIGIGLIISSALIDTPKEEVIRKTKATIQMFVNRDWSTLRAKLPQHISVDDVYNNRDELLDGAKKTVELLGLKSATVTSLELTQNDTAMTADLTIFSTQDATGDRPIPTNWRFDWENLGNGWVLDRIEPLEGRQVSKIELMHHMTK